MTAIYTDGTGIALEEVRARVRAVLTHRNWPIDWRSRLSYHLLEVAELTEAVRGKRGNIVDGTDPLERIAEEAGDALNTLLAMIPDEVSMTKVLEKSLDKLSDLMTRPRYLGEDYLRGPE